MTTRSSDSLSDPDPDPTSTLSDDRRGWTRWISAERAEIPALFLSTGYFFLLLFGYFIVRPLRESVGLSLGADQLYKLFLGSFVVMLAAVPLFGWLVARFPRRWLVPIVYHLFTIHLLVFAVLFRGPESDVNPELARVFYIWVSVFALFAVSVFWSTMADLFRHEQSKRLFGFISAGGTSGALAGSWFTVQFAEPFGTTGLLLTSAASLQLAILFMKQAFRSLPSTRDTARDTAVEHPSTTRDSSTRDPDGGRAIGGSVWGGFTQIARSPMLKFVCGYLFLSTMTSTFVHFLLQNLVEQNFAHRSTRTAFFAGLHLVIQALTLTVQILGTSRILRRYSVSTALATLPILYLAGFIGVIASPMLFIVGVFEVLRRVTIFAIAKPTLETIYTVVGSEARFKSKNFIDTVVYRGGDALGAPLFAGLRGLNVGLAGIALAVLPVCGIWVWVSARLASRQRGMTGPT